MVAEYVTAWLARLSQTECGGHHGSHTAGLNSVLLHRGHLPAASNVTGLVKCFTYRHSLHFHPIECCSCGRSDWANAFIAASRIVSRAAFSVLSAGSIDLTPSVDVCRSTCAIFAPRGARETFSCSHEHIRGLNTVEIKILRRRNIVQSIFHPRQWEHFLANSSRI